MATNKHAVIRYQALDKCFSNYGRRFYIEDLLDACNDAIYDFSGNTNGIQRRQLFEDIKFMESDAGYSVELEKIRDGNKKYYRYSDQNFSINKQPLNKIEAEQLKDTIIMLNRFKGLPQFDWMEDVLNRLQYTFNLSTDISSIVSFEQNPYLQGIEHFTPIFNAIINKQVLKIEYKASFKDPLYYEIHPHFLKQYNNRWFLFGTTQKNGQSRLTNMAIDRILNYESMVNIPYIENEIDFIEYFDDIVGITVLEGKPLELIQLKVDKNRYGYIESKPLHPSQKLRVKTEDYVIIELNLIPNYEFETLLLGFADSIEILKPQSLLESVLSRANRIIENNYGCADRAHINTRPL